MQAQFDICTAALTPIEASKEFFSEQAQYVDELLSKPEVTSLAITLPQAGPDHDASRRALARDLAREHAPKRVNIVAGDRGETLDKVLAYLRDAPGVTGQYLQTHE